MLAQDANADLATRERTSTVDAKPAKSTTSRLESFPVGRFLAAILLLVLAAVVAACKSLAPGDVRVSPDGLWTVLEEVELPERFSAPSTFVALSLDEAALAKKLAYAPRETFGRIPRTTRVWLPLPFGQEAPRSAGDLFAESAAVRSQLMEPALAARFPQISTYVFAGDGGAGHLAVEPNGIHIASQTGSGLWWVEPVETAAGRVYLAYLDRNRTDGADVVIHDPHMDDDEGPEPEPEPPAPPFPFLAPQLEAGSQLRIYRLAASTTGELFQGRDTGNGLFDVLVSLIIDVMGANAIFEPEVSVRLILATASLDVIYDDPDTDPFDNSDSACALRTANRQNMIDVLDRDDYDLGFLFAARSGSGANGCAWYVVCLSPDDPDPDDILHKASGAGKMGNNGANSASGLMAHEVGHQLGARHTFTGQAGGCAMNEFLAGDSESGYEPGSGTTRMSYRGNCQSDNVDTSAVPAGSYFHSRSFDEIVDNVFSGDGAACGTLEATGNQPPVVDAGPDYTIPRQTPFMLSGSATDDEPLTFNWEQYDRAITQRPINTDPGDGPLVRSVPPDADPTRIVPHLEDLLDGVTRDGEILPQTDREVNFRLIARDNLMGAGGVAYDSMVITVDGDPFFITSPNAGSLEAGCQEPLTWEVGGGSVAAQVEALFDDGGHDFATPLTGAVANDGEDVFTVPCSLGNERRIMLRSVDNIFFDVNDQDLTVFNTPPTVSVSTVGGAVDDQCELIVEFSAEVGDACGVAATDVQVELLKAEDNFTLGTPEIQTQQISSTEVSVTGSVLVSDLTDSPAQLSVQVTAADACGAETQDAADAVIVDETPPEIDVTLEPDELWPPNHTLRTVEATVVATDNCPGVTFVLSAVESDEPENGTGDGDTAPDIADAEIGTPDLEFLLRSERAGTGDGRTYTVTYTAVDGSDNETEDSATVEVPISMAP